jgi:starvation-inducible DNA-binding protein
MGIHQPAPRGRAEHRRTLERHLARAASDADEPSTKPPTPRGLPHLFPEFLSMPDTSSNHTADLRTDRHRGTIVRPSPHDVILPAAARESQTISLRTAGLLNQVLADTMTLRDLYKKSHWQASGPDFFSMHTLYDRHFEVQSGLVDMIAERIHTLGGVAVAMAADVSEISRIVRPPIEAEPTTSQLERLIEAHRVVLTEARLMANLAGMHEDAGTNDMMVSDVIRTGELQIWFLAQHLG